MSRVLAPHIALLAFVFFGQEFAERQELGEEWMTRTSSRLEVPPALLWLTAL